MATTPDNRPWAPHPIPSWIIKEFIRRQNDIGFEYPSSVTWGDNGTWQNYKGPLTAWVRVFSNGNGRINEKSNYPIRNGFILQGGYGFDKSYGLPNNKNVLGYDSEGLEHNLNLSDDGNLVSFPNSISTDNRTVQKFLPIPGITSIDAVIQKERIRKVTINWKCYGYAQLEYMTPYFLSPKISAFVEFGWNLFNPASLLDLRQTNLPKLKELFLSGSALYDENIKNSYGLYDVTMGIVSGFDFTSQDGITFDCKTEILSKHANYSGVLVNNGTKVQSDDAKTNVQSTFATYLEKRLTKLPECIKQKKNFMQPLDEQEIKAREKGEFKVITDFYSGKIENRFFVGRKYEYGDEELMRGMAKYDWDKSDQKDVWVTLGFLIELSNLFFTQLVDFKFKNGESFPLYKIDTSDVVIGAHPNLISCDGSVLLIPNASAPKYNIGNTYTTTNADDNDYQKQTTNVNPKIKQTYFERILKKINDLNPEDRTIAKVFKTGIAIRNNVGVGPCIMRDDLDTILNRFRYSSELGNQQSVSHSFPIWNAEEPGSGKQRGYWGYLNDLFINKNVIVECAKSSDTIESFYNSLLNKINNAAGKFWELSVVEDDKLLKIIDKKFIELNKLKIYQFDIGATNKFIKNINFTAQLSNVASNQVISSASNNSGKSPNGTVNSNQSLLFPYGDRFNDSSSSFNPKNVGLIDNNLESIRQLQNSPENAGGNKGGSYIMSFKSFGPSLSRAEAASRGRGTTSTPANPTRPGTRASAALAAGPRTTVPLNSNNPIPPSRAASSAPRTTTSTSQTNQENGWNIVNLVLPNEALLLALINDMDFEKNSNIYGGQQPGFTVEMTLQGISGLRTFQLFSLKNLPSPYSEKEIIFQIVDIVHKIEGGNWTTTIKAGIRSIRGQNIKFTNDGINEY